VTGTIRHRSVRHLIADSRRRCYRIAAAVTTVVAVAALTLGASGQLFAPDAPPSTTKAVLAQDTSTQDPSSQAAGRGSGRRRAASVPPEKENQPAPAFSRALSVDPRISVGPLPGRGYPAAGGPPGHAARTRRTSPSRLTGRFAGPSWTGTRLPA
jgi:hypothetical protein